MILSPVSMSNKSVVDQLKEQNILLRDILKQQQKSNVYNEIITDEKVSEQDIEE